jgi:hypothetical protein
MINRDAHHGAEKAAALSGSAYFTIFLTVWRELTPLFSPGKRRVLAIEFGGEIVLWSLRVAVRLLELTSQGLADANRGI